MMTFLNNHLLSLFLLGSLVPISEVTGQQYLRRRALPGPSALPYLPERCSYRGCPTDAEIAMASNHFVILEFEPDYFWNVDNETEFQLIEEQFKETYELLKECSTHPIEVEQFNTNNMTAEFIFTEMPLTDVTRVLMQIETEFMDFNFLLEDVQTYWGSGSNWDGSSNNCYPTRTAFVEAFARLNENFLNATVIPLLDPEGCETPEYNYEGICPSVNSGDKFSFFPTGEASPTATPEVSPYDVPSTESPTVPSTESPTVAPTVAPTVGQQTELAIASVHFVILEFEPLYLENVENENDEFQQIGKQFMDTYNSLVECDTNPIIDAQQFQTNNMLAEFIDTESPSDITRVLMLVDGYMDWDFFSENDLDSDNESTAPTGCKGPTRTAFVDKFAINNAKLRNAIHIPLLNPKGCEKPEYTYEGICPSGNEFFFSPP